MIFVKIHEFKNFELCEENVRLSYRRCRATENTRKPLPIKIYHPHLCGMDSPEIIFDAEKVVTNLVAIYHMIGQLKAVHDGQSFMASKQGYTNYKGEKWTEKASMLSALYALGVASTVITPFLKDDGMKFSVTDIRVVKPTWPRNDPNYHKNPLPGDKFLNADSN